MSLEEFMDAVQHEDELRAQKAERFETRVARDMLTGLGFRKHEALAHKFQARHGAADMEGFTPEWVSEELDLPITFRAVHNQEEGAKGFKSPSWLLAHRVDGPKTLSVWNDLWLETLDQFGGERETVAVCFKPKWESEGIITLHNYSCVLTHSTPKPCAGGVVVWMSKRGQVIMQYMKHLLEVLRAQGYPQHRSW